MEFPSIVFVVDDDESARLSLIAVLEAQQLLCRGFESAEDFLSEYDPRQAGCLVTDLAMPCTSGLDLHSELLRRGWIIPTVVVTGDADIAQTVQAMQQGVVSVLEKPYGHEDLLEAIQLALSSDASVRANARKLAELNHLFSQLTDAEVEVLDRLVSGKSNKVIASELGVAVRTVEHRRHKLSQKLGVQSVAALVALVVQRDHLLDSKPDIRSLAAISYRPGD